LEEIGVRCGGTRINRDFLSGNNGPLGNYIDPVGHLNESRDGTPLYLAYLMRPNGIGPDSAFGLYQDGSTVDFRQFHIGYTSANEFEAVIDPTGETADLGPGNTGVNLFVVRVDFAADADVISVWHNPALGGAEPPPDAQFTDFALGFNNLGMTDFNSGVSVDYDEIRLGSSWAGVTSADSLPLVQGTQAIQGMKGLPPGGVNGQYGYDFFPFVDTFGQYSHFDWANKIHYDPGGRWGGKAAHGRRRPRRRPGVHAGREVDLLPFGTDGVDEDLAHERRRHEAGASDDRHRLRRLVPASFAGWEDTGVYVLRQEREEAPGEQGRGAAHRAAGRRKTQGPRHAVRRARDDQ
jgi:hypothetical protein